MTSRNEVFEEVAGLLKQHQKTDAPVTPGSELGADLNIDSVAAMDLIMEIEDRFEIDIPVNKVSEMRTVGDLVAMVEAEVKDKEG